MKSNHTQPSNTKSTSILHKSMRIAVVAIAVFLCGISIVDFFNLPLSLSSFKKNIENVAQKATGMGVAIEGDCHLILGWRPSMEIQDLRLRQPSDQRDLLRSAYLKASIEILPLLKRKLRFSEIVVHGLDIDLGESDSLLNRFEDAIGMQGRKGQAPEIQSRIPSIWRVEATHIDLRDTTIHMGQNLLHTLDISEILGSITEKRGVNVDGKGIYRNIPWNVAWKSPSLTDLFSRLASWPFEMSAGYVGATLVASGRVIPAELKAVLEVRLSGSSGPELQSLLGDTFTELDSYLLSFNLNVDGSELQLTALEGELGNTRITGNARWEATGKRFSGAVNASLIDLEPVIRAVYPANGSERQPSTRIDAYRDIPISLPEYLSDLDVDLRFTCDQIVGIPGELQKATVRLLAKNGRFNLPVSIGILGSTIAGDANLTQEENMVSFSIDMRADRTDIGRFTHEFLGIKEVAGKLDGWVFSAAANGTDLPALLNDLEAEFEIRKADFSIDEPFVIRPMRGTIDTATLSMTTGGDIKGAIAGKLVDKPFALNVTSGSMRNFLEKTRWPVNLRFSGSGAEFHLGGTLYPSDETIGAELSLRLSGDRIGDLAAWTGISPSAEIPYELNTNVLMHQNRWQMDIHQVTTGNSTLKGMIKKEYSGNRQPKLAVSIKADLVDVRELKTIFLLPDDGDKSAKAPKWHVRTREDFALILDTMVFPQGFHLPEMDMNLNIRRVLTDRLTFDHCSLKVNIQKDHTADSHFQFKLGEASFRGEAFLDLALEPPELGLHFSTNRYELGGLLDALNVAKGVDAGVGTFEINMVTRGRKLSELILRREVSARVKQGRLVLKNLYTGFDMRIDSAEYADRPGEPFQLELQGHIHDVPLKVRWVTQKKHPEDAPGYGHASRLEAEVADTSLILASQVIFPIKRRGLLHQLTIRGKRLSSLDPLFNVPLPPLGPYYVSGSIRFLPKGYSLSDTVISIGDSRFLGQFQITTDGLRPRVTANLQAQTIHVRDFHIVKSRNKALRRQLRRFIDPSANIAMDGDITIEVSEILSGANRIGGGKLRIDRRDSHLKVAPLAFTISGGDVNGSLELVDTGDSVNGTLTARVHQVDFGPLLKLDDLDTMSRGRVSMVIDISSTAVSMDKILVGADGHFSVLIYPENIGARIFDFWATNLLIAILSEINPDNASKVNCIVADLTMTDGVMKEKKIVIDTSNVRVQGTGQIDFKNQTVYLRLKPIPKRPQFLYLATPMEVRGTFSDFRAGMNPGDFLGTIFGLMTDPIMVPMQWFFSRQFPEDGSDVCPDVTN